LSWEISLLVLTVLLTLVIAVGVPVAAAMGLVGIVTITLLRGTQLWPSIGDIIWNTASSFTLVAIPLFVLMGEIILRSGAARRFYMGLAVMLNNVPGGLAQSNILACALFSAICGSSTATTLTIGTVALPEMRKRGYSDRITLGTLTGGGALGNLIPFYQLDGWKGGMVIVRRMFGKPSPVAEWSLTLGGGAITLAVVVGALLNFYSK